MLSGDGRARVYLQIPNELVIRDDAMASVRTQGIIGDKYIRIIQGGSDLILKDGDFITETESALDLEEMVSKYIFGDV
jgi:phospholipid/cholesterol/gamma-HCH transport system substrate-binding protein